MKHSQRNKGFVSTYFLAILLYVTSVITMVSLVNQNKIKTVINMKRATVYLKQEIEVINDLKYRTLEEMEERELNTCSYTYEVEEQFIYIDIHSDYEESLVVTIDPEDHTILGYTSNRMNED